MSTPGPGGASHEPRDMPRASQPPRAPATARATRAWLRFRSAVRIGLAAAALTVAATHSVSAQGAAGSTEARLRQQQDELARIRREREELQRKMRELQSSVRDLSAEVRNLENQAATTERLVRSLDEQLAALNMEVDSATTRLQDAERQLGVKRGTLRRRVRDIYKRGALFDVEALLSAPSFGELLARYKYLHLLARHDRHLMQQVAELRDRTEQQRLLVLRLQQEVATNRTDKAQEQMRLRALEQERQRALSQTRRSATQTQQRLTQIARDEARLRDVIASLEEARRRAASRTDAPAVAAAAARSTIRTSDIGKLDWPVEGDIIYRFGRVVNPNNTATRWNGIGIAAAQGTRVVAISDGDVVLAEAIGTYGLTVIVQHGGGDYSVYGSLAQASVGVGTKVRKGQTLGTVGAADPDLPAHLHFEIRRDRGAAVDPLEWLRGNRK